MVFRRGRFFFVMVLFASIRERLAAADIPAPFRGNAIALVTAGLMSLAFMGFSGLVVVMSAIWIAIASISVLGLVFGIILGYASRRFAVEDDPVVEKLMNFYPRASAGSAVGCRPYAEAVGVQEKRSTAARRVAKRSCLK